MTKHGLQWSKIGSDQFDPVCKHSGQRYGQSDTSASQVCEKLNVPRFLLTNDKLNFDIIVEKKIVSFD